MDNKTHARAAMANLYQSTIREAHTAAMRRVTRLGFSFCISSIILWALALVVQDTSRTASMFLLLLTLGTVCAMLATAMSQIALIRSSPQDIL